VPDRGIIIPQGRRSGVLAFDSILWDLEDDPGGNVQHIREHGLTLEEVEDVLLDPNSSRGKSKSSSRPIAFGWTATGRHLAVVYETVDDDPLLLRPVTAYETPPPTRQGKGRRK